MKIRELFLFGLLIICGVLLFHNHQCTNALMYRTEYLQYDLNTIRKDVIDTFGNTEQILKKWEPNR